MQAKHPVTNVRQQHAVVMQILTKGQGSKIERQFYLAVTRLFLKISAASVICMQLQCDKCTMGCCVMADVESAVRI